MCGTKKEKEFKNKGTGAFVYFTLNSLRTSKAVVNTIGHIHAKHHQHDRY